MIIEPTLWTIWEILLRTWDSLLLMKIHTSQTIYLLICKNVA